MPFKEVTIFYIIKIVQMKKIFLSLSIVFFLVTGYAQNTSPFWSLNGNSNATSSSILGTTNAIDVRFFANNAERMRINASGQVAIGIPSPNNSAKLDISSITKGVLLPRMTLAQRNAIPSPATGLILFQTDNTPGFYYYSGSSWTALRGANTALSNLSAPTAINQSLLPQANNTFDLGSTSQGWRNVFASRSYYLGGSKVLDITGTNNTFVGNTTNTANTGTYNTFVGSSAGRVNSGGAGNIAVGAFAFQSNLTGNENVVFGRSSLYANTSGSYNTAVGNFALLANNLNQNTGVGYFSLGNTTASEGNTALGYQSGNSYNNGYYNCFIGSETNVNGANYYNVIAIGHGTICTAPSQVTVGNSATGTYRAYANWSNISDGRYKKNVKENVPGLSFINKLRPVTYNLDATGLDNFLSKNLKKENQSGSDGKAVMDRALTAKEAVVQSGFVAQEVEKSAHEAGYNFSGVDVAINDNDVYGLRYAEFVVPLVKAVQELSKSSDEKDKQIQELQLKNEDLNARLKKLELLFLNNSTATASAAGYLKQNVPNPANLNTVISFYVPANAERALIKITDSKGSSLKSYSASRGEGQVNIKPGDLPAGIYNYTLYVNDKLVDTKQMMIVK